MATHGGARLNAGRPKGRIDKRTLNIRERLQRLNCDPIAYLALTVNNEIPCGVCNGTGKTAFQPLSGDQPGVRTCQSCWGSKRERLSPKERSWAAGELLQYCEAKLKQVDHTSTDGSHRPIWVVNVAPEVPGIPAPASAVRLERKQQVLEATATPLDDDVQ
jgi:hypothetical protein